MNDEAPRGAGDNLPPSGPIDPDQWGKLQDQLGVLRPRAEYLIGEAAKIPELIPEDMAPKVTDFIKSMTTHVKAIEGARVANKEPYLQAGRLVDGLFGNLREQLLAAKTKIETQLAVTLRRKERREREAARLNAEKERQEAEARKREADRIARLERERADAAKRVADEAERKAREEAEAAQREVEAAEQRTRDAEAAAALKKRNARRTIERARAAEQQARAEAAEAERAATEEAISAGIDRRIADRQVGEVEQQAQGEGRRVDAAEAKVMRTQTAKPAVFARTRGEYGGVGSLQRYWTFANIDRDTLDLARLRQFIPMDELERAVRAYIDAGGHKLIGVDIFEDDKPRVT